MKNIHPVKRYVIILDRQRVVRQIILNPTDPFVCERQTGFAALITHVQVVVYWSFANFRIRLLFTTKNTKITREKLKKLCVLCVSAVKFHAYS